MTKHNDTIKHNLIYDIYIPSERSKKTLNSAGRERIIVCSTACNPLMLRANLKVLNILNILTILITVAEEGITAPRDSSTVPEPVIKITVLGEGCIQLLCF